MIEIFSIFIQILILNIFFLFPVNIKNIKFYFNFEKPSIFDIYIVNTIFYFIVFLFISFFKLKLNYFFFLFITLSILSLILNYKNYKKYFLENDNLKFFIFFLVCFLSISFVVAANPVLAWDGIAHWYFKVLNFNQNQTYENLKNLYFSYYPHLGSYVWNFFWVNNFLNLEYIGRIFFIFIFLISIFSASDKLKFKRKISTKVLITLILVFFIYDIFLLSGYQEYLIFFLFYAFSLFYHQYKNTREKNLQIYILIFSVIFLMFWFKQEGFFYTIILGFLFILFENKKLHIKIFLGLLIILGLYTFINIKIYFHGSFSFNEKIIHAELLKYLDPFIFAKTLVEISFEIIKAFIKYPIWLIIFLILLSDIYQKKIFNNINLLFFIIFIGFVYAVFLQTTMDIKQLMPLTLDRLIFHGSGFYLIYVINFFNNNLKKIDF